MNGRESYRLSLEAEPVLLSALEHFSYCPRQLALIHVERIFDDNVYTVRGHLAHTEVDQEAAATESGVRVERSLPVWSHRLGLLGKADLVEFRPEGPYPVEYKVGPRRNWGHDDLQLAGQAMCLEDMFGVPVPRGAIFHKGSRRRREVVIDQELQAKVEEATAAIRRILSEGRLPDAPDDKRCPNCSLYESCMPSLVSSRRRVRMLRETLFAVDTPLVGGS